MSTISQIPISNHLQDQARLFILSLGMQFDGEFEDTTDRKPIKFLLPGKAGKRCWLHCQYGEITIPWNLEVSKQPYLRVVVGCFDDENPHRSVRQTFFESNEVWSGLSADEKAAVLAQQTEYRRLAQVKSDDEKRIVQQRLDHAIERFGKAVCSIDKDEKTYLSNKGLDFPGDVHSLRWLCEDDRAINKLTWIGLATYRNIAGKICAIEELYPSKRHFYNDEKSRNKNTIGLTAGNFVAFGGLIDGHPIYISEGIATAITVFLATNVTTLATGSCSNISNVVANVMARYPNSQVTICADNDHHHEKNNPGLDAAKLLSKTRGCIVKHPTFPPGHEFDDNGSPRTDFDDLRQLCGIQEVTRQLTTQIQNINACDAFNIKVLPDLIANYVSAITYTTEAHKIMIVQAVITACSALFMSSMYLKEGEYFQILYPNIWAQSIAASGEHKTTAIQKGSAIVYSAHDKISKKIAKLKAENNALELKKDKESNEKKHDDLRMQSPLFPSKASPEAIIERCEKGGFGVIISGELGAWLSSMSIDRNTGMKEMMTELYDGNPYTYETRTRGKLHINKALFSICGVSTLPWLVENLSQSDLTNGFFARFLTFLPPIKENYMPPALPKPNTLGNVKHLQSRIEDVITSFKNVNTSPLEYTLSDEAKVRFERYHKEIYDHVYSCVEVENCQQELNSNCKRWSPYIIKMAMVLQPFFDPNSNEISALAIDAGYAIVRCAMLSTVELVTNHLKTSSVDQTSNDLLAWIIKRYRKCGRAVLRKEILASKKCNGRREYDECLGMLIECGSLLEGKDAKKASVPYAPTDDALTKYPV
jgi:hypothetical protein